MMPVPEALKEATAEALMAKMVGDHDRADKAIETILEYGNTGMFTACAYWAHAISRILFGVSAQYPCHDSECDHNDTTMGFSIENRETGEVVNPDSIQDPTMVARVWAIRFVAAVGNSDLNAASALFVVAASTDEPVGYGPFALLDMAADTMRSQGSWKPT